MVEVTSILVPVFDINNSRMKKPICFLLFKQVIKISLQTTSKSRPLHYLAAQHFYFFIHFQYSLLQVFKPHPTPTLRISSHTRGLSNERSRGCTLPCIFHLFLAFIIKKPSDSKRKSFLRFLFLRMKTIKRTIIGVWSNF